MNLNQQQISVLDNPYKMPEYTTTSKTYEEIMGPNSSLNDILNFDFSGRWKKREP